jgi:hypothetical protein
MRTNSSAYRGLSLFVSPPASSTRLCAATFTWPVHSATIESRSPNHLRRTSAKWMRLARMAAEWPQPLATGTRRKQVYGRLSPEEISALLSAHFADKLDLDGTLPSQTSRRVCLNSFSVKHTTEQNQNRRTP